MKIAVAGVGYVGLSLAVLFAKHHEVVTINVHQSKTDLINNKKSPIKDAEIEDYLANKPLNLHATTDWHEAISGADFVVIATPTNYDDKRNFFDTSAVEDIIEKTLQVQSKENRIITMVVKSTIPVGFIEKMRKKYPAADIFFSPEFLREGHALYDNLYPSRIIIGSDSEKAHIFADLLLEGAEKSDIPVKFIGATEAEAVKLFANTYLAVRIAYFNELDTYAETHSLDSKDIIDGVCLDPRIGNHYNNPSFGYGGYCLPKDTKQLLADFGDTPEELISAVVASNKTRKDYIANQIAKKSKGTIGIFRLTMKSGSDNFRASAIQDIIASLIAKGRKVIVYEPTSKEESFLGAHIEPDFEKFKKDSSIIIANRPDSSLDDVKEKLYTRNIYSEN